MQQRYTDWSANHIVFSRRLMLDNSNKWNIPSISYYFYLYRILYSELSKKNIQLSKISKKNSLKLIIREYKKKKIGEKCKISSWSNFDVLDSSS